MSAERGPWLARMILRIGLGRSEREFMAGDVEEEYATVIVPLRGARAARRWYWRQVLGTVLSRRLAGVVRAAAVPAGAARAFAATLGVFARPLELRTTVRALARSPAFTATVVLLMAVGLGATTAVWSVVRGVLLQPLPYPEPDRLVQVFETEVDRATGEVERRGYFAWQNYADLRDEAAAFEALTAWQYYDRTLTGVQAAQRLAGRMVTPEFFAVLRTEPVLGRAFAAGDYAEGAARVAILGHGVWRSAFGGDASVIGREVRLDGIPHVVVGVMPAGFDFPYEADLWMPLFPELGPDGAGARRYHRYRVAGRLGAGSSLEAARAQATTVAARLEAAHPATNAQNGFRVVPLRDVLVGDARPALVALFGAVALLLVIACANVAGLLLVRAVARDGEMSIRRALGAGRTRIAGQLLAESVILALAGGAIGLGIARWAVSGFKALVGDALPRAEVVVVDPSVVLVGLAASLGTGLLFGIAPVLRAGRDTRFGQSSRRSSATREVLRFRRTLVLAQLSLACVLAVSSVLLLRTFARLSAVETGIDVDGLVALDVSLPEARYASAASRHTFFVTLVEALRERPGLEGAAAGLVAPLSGFGWGNGLHVERRPVAENEIPTVSYNVVTPGYFEVAGIRLLEGRTLTERDGREAVVVNRVLAARTWPGESAVGQRVRFADDAPWSTVVGVVDAVPSAAGEPAGPRVYVPLVFENLATMSVLVRAREDAGAAIGIVREAVQALDAEAVVTDIATIRDRMAETLARPRYTATIVAMFGATALLLACAGVYGVLAYAVAQRGKEMGIRLALGADPASLRTLIVRQGAAVVGTGVVIGTLAAVAAARLIRELLYDTSPTDLLTFPAVALIVFAIGLAACYGPAARAARTDPMRSLSAD